MNYIPYGYKIENGEAVIVEKEAEQLKKMFDFYLSGLSLAEVAKETGILKPHPSIGKMLRNRRYLGNGFYPPMIDEDTFHKAEDERVRRAKMLGRIREPKDNRGSAPIVSFSMPVSKQLYENPYMQAEYAYSVIECEVAEDAE
ncbi:recombinase [Anaerocolumna sp. MB42-C2]|uniref:recombinase n=1 Tax=Anaerocolumna sp. MB42-C2 TaxID=3070997 RepID=UPI0027E065E7|nr:recombinase [Anaerocolumna sp. MB42-C2]WMJ86777.1 recombinase [Anaerocolumna sp. MB42-C2]